MDGGESLGWNEGEDEQRAILSASAFFALEEEKEAAKGKHGRLLVELRTPRYHRPSPFAFLLAQQDLARSFPPLPSL